jgi:O-Antigen ligase
MNRELYLVARKTDSVFLICLKGFIAMLLGSAEVSSAGVAVKAVSVIILFTLFIVTIANRDYISFLLQLFLCNQFVYGDEYGGLFNLTACAAIVFYYFAGNDKYLLANSSLKKPLRGLVLCLLVIQVMAVFGSSFGTSAKLIGVSCFLICLLLFYFSSCIQFEEEDFHKFIWVACLGFMYMFIVSVNQKYLFNTANYPFFPIPDEKSEWELDITRTSGTLHNYEAYAEYSVTLTALILPGILSGYWKKSGKYLYYTCLLTIIIAFVAIVFSGTRSSILLLVVLYILAIFTTKNVNKAKTFLFFGGAALLLIASSIAGVFDFSVFSQRSESMDVQHLTTEKLVSGEELNRGIVFANAFKRIGDGVGIFGGGYFPDRDSYRFVHFGTFIYDFDDYHNLYLSIIVIWGFAGAAIFVSLFLVLYRRGVKLYRRVKYGVSPLKDILLGFNLAILLLLINQLKIQFIRDVNYFMMILILLSLYSNLIRTITNNESETD